MIDLSQLTYQNILQAMLSVVPNTFDKRDTSPIQTALGPAAYAIQDFFLALDAVQQGTFITTATGSDLDELAVIGNLTREPATYAVRLGEFNMAVPIGSRFSTINGENSINFIVTASAGTNQYRLTAETAGTIGNEYAGAILPITPIQGLTVANLTEIIVPGDDEETDAELRERLIEALNYPAFGGNIAAYKQFCKTIDGVGDVQVYPTWNGGGTVKLSVIGSDWKRATTAVVSAVQEAVDPDVNHGLGLGMAPIGARVTVVRPTNKTINVQATLLLEEGYTTEMVQDGVEEAIEAYLENLRKDWADNKSKTAVSYSTTVYRNAVIAAIVGAEGVVNVSALKLNSGSADVTCTETATTQQLPVLGTVTIS